MGGWRESRGNDKVQARLRQHALPRLCDGVESSCERAGLCWESTGPHLPPPDTAAWPLWGGGGARSWPMVHHGMSEGRAPKLGAVPPQPLLFPPFGRVRRLSLSSVSRQTYLSPLQRLLIPGAPSCRPSAACGPATDRRESRAGCTMYCGLWSTSLHPTTVGGGGRICTKLGVSRV